MINQILHSRKTPRGLLFVLVCMLSTALLSNFWRPVLSTAQTVTDALSNIIYFPLIQRLGQEYAVLTWNDLGMHCYNRDFQDLAVLPPYNTLWVQVLKRGDPPQIITNGIVVEFSFPDNTYSIGKSNFWDYDLDLFGVDLPSDTGLTGTGLQGEMILNGDHFVAEGIPLTEYNDGDHTTRVPYQLATIIVKDANGTELARNRVVAPVSTEMRCDNCHYDGAFGISTGRVETNILTLHDEENLSEYPPGQKSPLMTQRPVLCAECHASNALNSPGIAGIPNLSKAMHEKHHIPEIPDTTAGCYSCHPGPDTKCLRDVMSSQFSMNCLDCHGTMLQVSQNPDPWLNEPRCDHCHDDPGYEQDQPLYRMSKGHGGIYCEACHDSTHAIALSTQPEDAIKFVNLQGHDGTLAECTACHLSVPTSGGPHN